MGFSELELHAIDKAVGTLCRDRSPAQYADELRTVYEVDGHVVTVFEDRPAWDDPSEWMHSPVARFRYFRSRDEWVLYWMRADLKWHVYEPDPMPTDLISLVALVDQDRYGAFFG